MNRSICYGVISALLLVSFRASATLQTTLDLFPKSFEEYDDLILDPEHGFGSPFGGFGRATRSRLAALPLFLPDTDAQDPDAEPFHTQVRDAEGRLFVCRVYHEDELDPSSLYEGMFEPPRERKDAEETPVVTDADAHVSIDEEQNNANGNSADPSADDATKKDGDEEKPLVPAKKSPEEWAKEMDKLLKPLEGLCAQVHKGWWSYEWCYKESITQFHVEISKMTSTVQVQDITSLGDYDGRTVIDLENPDEEGADAELADNFLAQGRPELARVNDKYLHGTICPGTKKERESMVHLVCCSKATVQRRKGLVHRDNVHVATDVMSIYEVEESKTSICSYNITVCTPLLCKDNDSSDSTDDTAQGASSATGGRLKDRRAKPATPPKENESILEILERTLDGFCLQTSTGGWWTYEICHKKNIRQYHEVLGTRKTKNGAVYTARSVEADHNLGNYQSTKFGAIVPEDEYKFVVNATDKKGGSRKPYFELEYVGGDVCDHSDVTDAAIVAGSTDSSQKGIYRASSVRYQCGEAYDISVSEDSTCHYIVWVELPDLCNHPLFKVPTTKKQVFKCLHVPDDNAERVEYSEDSAPTAAEMAAGENA